MVSYRWCAAVVTGCMVLGACRAQGQDTPAAPAPPAAPSISASTDTTTWLVADTAAKIVALSLEATRAPGAGSALINGSRAGQTQVVVPFGWTVTWNWRNQDSTAPHSLVVMMQREKIPLEGGRPAFSNAMTRMVTEGLPAGQTDRATFETDEAGWYWMLCGVPGHAVAGEWIELQVSREAATPALKQKAR
jgi:Sulfocyanin (SoxE) domain